MSRNYEALNYAKHGKLSIKPGLSLAGFDNQSMVPVVLHEIEHIASELPIVFVRNEKNELTPVALLSLTNENNYIKDGKWQARVLPKVLLNQPFALGQGKKEGEFLVALDTKNELVSDNGEGESIFDKDGKESAALTNRKKHLITFTQQQHLTKQFTKLLADKKLITAREITLEKEGKKIKFPQIFVLDASGLENLSQKSLIEFKKMGILGKCYALAHSLEQLGKLAESI